LKRRQKAEGRRQKVWLKGRRKRFNLMRRWEFKPQLLITTEIVAGEQTNRTAEFSSAVSSSCESSAWEKTEQKAEFIILTDNSTFCPLPSALCLFPQGVDL
jgi:hypothetical protein